jgi:hypothetical protein
MIKPGFLQNKKNRLKENKMNENNYTIESLANALGDYQEKISDRLSLLEKQAHNAEVLVQKMQTVSTYEPILPSFSIADYVMKREVPTMIDGLAFLPYPSYVKNPAHPKSLMRLARQIVQNNGTDHLLLTMPTENIASASGIDVLQLPHPTPLKLVLHDLQAEISLLPQTISGQNPVNFNTYLNNTLEYYFTSAENRLLISNDGVANKITGIGNLTTAGYQYLQIEYRTELDITGTLAKMLGMLAPEYHQNAAWFMSPEMFAAILAIRDANGRYINQEKLFGFPVYCNANFNNTNSKILFANIEDRERKYAGVGCVQAKLERVRETVIGFRFV